MDIIAKLEEARKCINQALIGLGKKGKDEIQMREIKLGKSHPPEPGANGARK